MASLYGSNEWKRAGMVEQPRILEKVLKFLRSEGYDVIGKEATLFEDMNDKFDYCLTFNKSKLFLGRDKIYIDVKYAATVTLIDRNGHNTLENSKSDYIIFNTFKKPHELRWVNTKALKRCLKENEPILYRSKEIGNNSEYFWIEDYIRKHYKWFEGNSKVTRC